MTNLANISTVSKHKTLIVLKSLFYTYYNNYSLFTKNQKLEITRSKKKKEKKKKSNNYYFPPNLTIIVPKHILTSKLINLLFTNSKQNLQNQKLISIVQKQQILTKQQSQLIKFNYNYKQMIQSINHKFITKLTESKQILTKQQ